MVLSLGVLTAGIGRAIGLACELRKQAMVEAEAKRRKWLMQREADAEIIAAAIAARESAEIEAMRQAEAEETALQEAEIKQAMLAEITREAELEAAIERKRQEDAAAEAAAREWRAGADNRLL